MNNGMFGVMVESDMGLDPLGNPKGKPMVFERIGAMTKGEAIDQASKIQAHGKYGKVKLVHFEVLDCIIT